MLDLTAQSPADANSHSVANMTLAEFDPGPMTLLMPYKGKTALLSKGLQAAHGLPFPEPNRVTDHDESRAIWFGAHAALLMGTAADARLRAHAAMSDQSDAWTCLTLTGAGAEDVLARLIPVDLRAAAFPEDQTARTQIGHMSGSVSRLGSDRFLLMVFRSMAATLFHEVTQAMDMLAARSDL